MRKLSFPDDMPDSLEVVCEALLPGLTLEAKDKGFLRSAFDEYVIKRAFAHHINPNADFNNRNGDAFRSAYEKTHSGRKLDHVRNILLDSAGNRCPFCGGGRPNQLDHHLPQDRYGEFAIFVKNLVPSCGDCNRKKSNYVSTHLDNALLHPYLDDIPNLSMFQCDTVIRDNVLSVTFNLDLSPEIDPAIARRLKFQYSRIDLNANLWSEISEVITEYVDILNFSHEPGDAEKVSNYLKSEAGRHERLYYKSFWKAVFLNSLADNVEFCAGAYRAVKPQLRRHSRRGLS